jgi:hypothetical protein
MSWLGVTPPHSVVFIRLLCKQVMLDVISWECTPALPPPSSRHCWCSTAGVLTTFTFCTYSILTLFLRDFRKIVTEETFMESTGIYIDICKDQLNINVLALNSNVFCIKLILRSTVQFTVYVCACVGLNLLF